MCLFTAFKLLCWGIYLVLGSITAYFVGGIIGVTYIQTTASSIIESAQNSVISVSPEVVQVSSPGFTAWGFIGILTFWGATLVFL